MPITYEQLSPERQQEALDAHRDWNVDHDNWWEGVYEHAKEAGNCLGIDIDQIYFSGFCSQGDGACFAGSGGLLWGASARIRDYSNDTELHDIADAWVREHRISGGGWTFTVRQSGHYQHENCTSFGWEHEDFPWDEPDNVKDLQETVRALMRWIYRQLEAEYDYLTSDEAVAEALIANDFKFDEDEEEEPCQ